MRRLSLEPIEKLLISTFISNPPGARIEIDGEYIGKTPITIEWPRSYQDGSRFNDEITIKAFPSGPRQFQQKKFFENAPSLSISSETGSRSRHSRRITNDI